MIRWSYSILVYEPQAKFLFARVFRGYEKNVVERVFYLFVEVFRDLEKKAGRAFCPLFNCSLDCTWACN